MTFHAIEPLRVMLSSRCADLVPLDGKPRPMKELRTRVKQAIEGLQLHGEPMFTVWTHESESILPADANAWQACMAQARKADLVLVLYNGNAGWTGPNAQGGGSVGICHAELAEALASAPSKVRMVQLLPLVKSKAAEDRRFQKFVTDRAILGAQVETGEDAIEQCLRAAVAGLLDLARAGIGVASRRQYYAGEALAWSRLEFGQRRDRMSTVLRASLAGQDVGPGPVVREIRGTRIAFVCDAIAGPMSVAAARELVGQPFLRDHLVAATLSRGVHGPVHVIACHRGVTEAQAVRQLGYPDVQVVAAPFGVYVADEVHKIQMVFLANCRDETSTRHATQQFLEWATAQGEDEQLARRARSRRRIAEAVHGEQQPR